MNIQKYNKILVFNIKFNENYLNEVKSDYE